MSGFAARQARALNRKLDRKHVQSKEVEGRSLDYIEGWFAISQANAIFGFDGWDREMTHFERVYERNRENRTSCAYVARIRIRVRASETVIVREGTGWGHAAMRNPAEAHELALKAAETDATKRALATFGNRFGLGLYDKEQNGVSPKKQSCSALCLIAPDGVMLADNLSPESFCGGLRQLIEKLTALSDVEALQRLNYPNLLRLRLEAPDLKTNKGIHYAEVLERFLAERIASLTIPVLPAALPVQEHAEPAPSTEPPLLKESKIAPGPRIDKAALTIGTERRLRDRDHLLRVAHQPCLICGRQPSHAHHLTFAQKRGLAMKVSDEFTVPLCSVHHDELHRSGDERGWWTTKDVSPLGIAEELWRASRSGKGRYERMPSHESRRPAPEPADAAIDAPMAEAPTLAVGTGTP